MRRLLAAWADALTAMLESIADAVHRDTEARYWRGYEDGVRDAHAVTAEKGDDRG